MMITLVMAVAGYF